MAEALFVFTAPATPRSAASTRHVERVRSIEQSCLNCGELFNAWFAATPRPPFCSAECEQTVRNRVERWAPVNN